MQRLSVFMSGVLTIDVAMIVAWRRSVCQPSNLLSLSLKSSIIEVVSTVAMCCKSRSALLLLFDIVCSVVSSEFYFLMLIIITAVNQLCASLRVVGAPMAKLPLISAILDGHSFLYPLICLSVRPSRKHFEAP